MLNLKKALLFIPPAYTFEDSVDINPLPPLGLGYIGAILESMGIEVKIVDCLMEGWHTRERMGNGIVRIGLSLREIEDVISDFGPDVVGVNNLFTKQRNNAHDIYRVAKEIDGDIITIAGGAHPTVLPELVMSDSNVDYAVLGEGEETIGRLVDAIDHGEEAMEGIDGVASRRNNHVILNPKTSFINNLDSIPLPARHLLSMKKYFGLKSSHGARKKERFSPVITSRGCSAGCTFCSAHKVWGSKFRVRSPENVMKELRELRNKYGIEEVMFEDDNLTLNKDRAKRLFRMMINEKLNLVWDTPNGVAAFSLDEELIDLMKESGCYKLNLALESGSQYVLDNIIKKPLKLEGAKKLVKYARGIGLKVGIYLIMGMPGETREQMMESFRMARELEVYEPTISIATPYPGSVLYELCKEKGYISEDYSLDDLFVKSYSISTKDWTGSELRDIVKEGKRYLLRRRLKTHPLEGLRLLLESILSNPKTFSTRAVKFVRRDKCIGKLE